MSEQKENVYRYYLEVENKEHMLYNKEIAIKYGISTKSGHPHARLVGAIIDKYKREHCITEKYYFKNRFGLSEVTPHKIYDAAMIDFITVCENRSEAYIGQVQYNFKLNN